MHNTPQHNLKGPRFQSDYYSLPRTAGWLENRVTSERKPFSKPRFLYLVCLITTLPGDYAVEMQQHQAI